MFEFDEFPHSVWWEIEKYFVEKMLTSCTYSESCERTYRDSYLTIVININFSENRIRINIGSLGRRFSKSFLVSGYDKIVDSIFQIVESEGGDNKDILANWVELKKIDIRDIKINKLLK